MAYKTKSSILSFSTSLTDSTGDLGTWKVVNSPSLVDSNYSYGKSAYFPDYNNWIESNFNVSSLMKYGSFTIRCYFKITHTGSGAIFCIGNDRQFMDYRITNQNSRFYCSDGNGSWVIAGDTYWDSGRGRGMGTYTIPLNQWNKFELVWEQGDQVTIYINDIQDINIDISNYSLPTASYPIKVGAGCSESGQGIYINDFEIDIDVYTVNTKISNDVIFEIVATPYGIIDLVEDNIWTGYSNMPLSSQDQTIINSYSIYIPQGQSNYGLQIKSPDNRMLLTPTDRLTFSCWMMPFNESNGRFEYSTLFNGKRASGYQRLSYKYSSSNDKRLYYSHRNGTVYDMSKQITSAMMYDGNWHHIAFTHDDNSTIYTFFDGELVKTEQETEDIDWRYMCILIEGSGDNNSWSSGYFDDITFIKGRTLWTSDFTPSSKNFIGKIPIKPVMNNFYLGE